MNGSAGLGFAAFRIRVSNYATKTSGNYTYEFRIPISFFPSHICLCPSGSEPYPSSTFAAPFGCSWELNANGTTSELYMFTINTSNVIVNKGMGSYTDRYQATYSNGYLTINLQGKNGVTDVGIYKYDEYTLIASQLTDLS